MEYGWLSLLKFLTFHASTHSPIKGPEQELEALRKQQELLFELF